MTRVTDLLTAWHDRPGRLVAVTHAAVIKVAVVSALRAPADAVWDLDVAPGSFTELHATAAGWRVVRVNGEPQRQAATQVRDFRQPPPD